MANGNSATDFGMRNVVTSIILSSLVSCLVVLGGGWAIVSTVFQVHLQAPHPGSARTAEVTQVGARILDGQARIISRMDRFEALMQKHIGRDEEDDN